MTLEKFVTIQIGSSLQIQGIFPDFKSLLSIALFHEKSHKSLKGIAPEHKAVLPDVRHVKQ